MSRRFLLRRLLGLAPTLLCIVVLSFCVIRLAPGSPFSTERAVSPQIKETLERTYGLDKPLWAQLGRYLGNLLHGDLGVSMKYPQRTVNEIIAEGLPVTLTLGLCSLVWALLLGVCTGVMAALYHGSGWDKAAMAITSISMALPSFVLAPILILLLSLHMWWLPPAGWGEARHLVLPALSLGTAYAATLARLTRGGLLEVMHADYIRTARSKGLAEYQVVTRHMLRGGLLPVVTYLGPAITHLLVGSVVIEKIFNIPGIGPYFVDAAFNRDYFLVMGIVILESTLLLVTNFLVDIVYSLLDPRVTYA